MCVYKRDWNPVVVEEGSCLGPELVDLVNELGEEVVVLDPVLLPGTFGHRAGPLHGHPVVWMVRLILYLDNNLKFKYIKNFIEGFV